MFNGQQPFFHIALVTTSEKDDSSRLTRAELTYKLARSKIVSIAILLFVNMYSVRATMHPKELKYVNVLSWKRHCPFPFLTQGRWGYASVCCLLVPSPWPVSIVLDRITSCAPLPWVVVDVSARIPSRGCIIAHGRRSQVA